MVDGADLGTGRVDYLRWGRRRAVSRAADAGRWELAEMVRQQEIAGAYTILDLNRHPVLLGDPIS